MKHIHIHLHKTRDRDDIRYRGYQIRGGGGGSWFYGKATWPLGSWGRANNEADAKKKIDELWSLGLNEDSK